LAPLLHDSSTSPSEGVSLKQAGSEQQSTINLNTNNNMINLNFNLSVASPQQPASSKAGL
jgi:hypothetical protein